MNTTPLLDTATSWRNRPLTWMLALAAVCGLILAYGYTYSTNTSSDLPYLLGYSMIPALVISWIFIKAFAPPKVTGVGGIVFSFIFAALLGSHLIAYAKFKEDTKQMFSTLKQEVANLETQSRDAEGLPKQVKQNINTTPSAKGDLGVMEGFLKQVIVNGVTLQNNYLREMDAIAWDTILAPSRVNQDTAFTESRQMITTARALVDKYSRQGLGDLQRQEENIRALPLNESMKRNMLNGFNKNREENEKQYADAWTLEEVVLDEFENIINLLARDRDAWIVQEGQLLFYKDADLAQFNGYIKAIGDIAARQEALRQHQSQKMNALFDSMK